MSDTHVVSPYLTLLLTGTTAGLDCGTRPSGLRVARQDGSDNVHLLYPKAHAKVVEGVEGAVAKEPGRAWISKKHDPATVVVRIEDAIAAAKAARKAAPVAFPALDGVEATVDGDEILIRMADDRDALSTVKDLSWDEARGAWVGAPSKARAAATALKALVAVRAERAAASAEVDRQARARDEAARLRDDLRGRLRGSACASMTFTGGVRFAFPYDASLVALVKRLPHASYDPGTRTWHVTAKTAAHVDCVVAAAAAVDARVPELVAAEAAHRERVAEERAANARRWAAERAAADAAWHAANPYRIAELRGAPAVGETVRLHGDGVVTVLRHGRPFRADEDTSSLGGPVGAEGELCCRVYHRAATADEVAALKAREGRERAVREAAALVRSVECRVDREGEAPDLGREPEGEVLVRHDRSAAYGYATRLVLDAEGALWHVTYDGSDGGSWGMYNLGYNTQGRRLRITPDEVAALRGAIAAAGEAV